MRYFLLLLFSAGVGLVEQVTPPVWGWLYELVAPFSTVLAIIVGWRRVSLLRKLALLTLALIVGYFASWSLHALAYRPNNAIAMRAGLILFAIRLAIGIWVLIPAHVHWKNKGANAASDSGPASSSGSFQRMTPFEAGAILGVIGGAVAGAVLCKSHGMLAEIGGAIGGGVVGLFAGALLVFPISFAYGLAMILARIYWEVLTGRRKLPSMSSQTKVHRRMMFKLMAVIFMVTAALWTGLYFAEPDAIRSRLLWAVAPLLGTFFIGLLILIVAYRRYPPQKELQEFSTNFDSKMVRPFLERIQPFIESGFGSAQIEQVCQVVATLPHDQERTLEFQIRHAGKDARFEVHIFMDDIDSPDIYFFSPSALKQQIESEFERFAEERGI
jgi:MFS family permease